MSRSILEDVRLAGRNLWKDRAFAVLTIVTLAVAIGANTAIGRILVDRIFADHRVRIRGDWGMGQSGRRPRGGRRQGRTGCLRSPHLR